MCASTSIFPSSSCVRASAMSFSSLISSASIFRTSASRSAEYFELSSLTTPRRYFFPFSFCENNCPAENPRIVMNVSGSATSTNSARRSRSRSRTSFFVIFQKFMPSIPQCSSGQIEEQAFQVVLAGFDREHFQLRIGQSVQDLGQPGGDDAGGRFPLAADDGLRFVAVHGRDVSHPVET